MSFSIFIHSSAQKRYTIKKDNLLLASLECSLIPGLADVRIESSDLDAFPVVFFHIAVPENEQNHPVNSFMDILEKTAFPDSTFPLHY